MSSTSPLACKAQRFGRTSPLARALGHFFGTLLGLSVMFAAALALLGATTLWLGLIAAVALADGAATAKKQLFSKR